MFVAVLANIQCTCKIFKCKDESVVLQNGQTPNKRDFDIATNGQTDNEDLEFLQSDGQAGIFVKLNRCISPISPRYTMLKNEIRVSNTCY